MQSAFWGLMPTDILFSQWTNLLTTSMNVSRLFTFSKKVSESAWRSQRKQGERISTSTWQRSTPFSISLSESVLKQSSMASFYSNSTRLNRMFLWLFEQSFSMMVLLSECRLAHSSRIPCSCSPLSGRRVTSMGMFFSANQSTRETRVLPSTLRQLATIAASAFRLLWRGSASSYWKDLARASRRGLLASCTSMAMRSSMGMWKWSDMLSNYNVPRQLPLLCRNSHAITSHQDI